MCTVVPLGSVTAEPSEAPSVDGGLARTPEGWIAPTTGHADVLWPEWGEEADFGGVRQSY